MSKKGGLEGMLSPGLRRESSGSNIPVFPSYAKDVASFKRPAAALPFVNQEQSFMQVARALATGYPYVVLIGESGIGKSMVLDHVVDVITGKVSLAELKKRLPQAVPLFSKVIDKARTFEQRHYLLLPNLRDPMNPVSFAYTDIAKAEADNTVAEEFCVAVRDYLAGFAEDNKENIRIRLTRSQFTKLVRSSVQELYADLYVDVMDEVYKRKDDRTPNRAVTLDGVLSVIGLRLPKVLRTGPKGGWRLHNADKEQALAVMREDAGYTLSRGSLTKGEIETGLANTVLPRIVRDGFDKLMFDVRHVDIIDAEGENEAILHEEFRQYTDKSVQELGARIAQRKLRNQRDVVGYVKAEHQPYYPPRTISEGTISLVVKRLEAILEDSLAHGGSAQLNDWMRSVVSYFSTEPRVLSDAFESMLQEIEHSKFHEVEADDDDEDDDEIPAFAIRHGESAIHIEELLEPNFFKQVGSSSGISWTKVGDVDEEALFATYAQDMDELPPHRRLGSLGQFFRHGLLLFRDSFSDFIEIITHRDVDKKRPAMREQFLEYLQSGVFTLLNKGVTYKLEAPRMILACDNEDPFQTIKGAFFVRDETGLRGRIRTVDVPAIAQNTADARQGTLRVIYDALDSFNKRHKRAERLSLNNEAAAMLLSSTLLTENLASLRYRSFTQLVEDTCAFALSNGVRTITPAILRERFKDTYFYPGFFESVDREKKFDGYFSQPKAGVGNMNGLAIYEDGSGILCKLRSYLVPPLAERGGHRKFELIDISSKLAGKSTIKGYRLAADFIQRLVGGKGIPESDWCVKTHFKDEWHMGDGPSASTAIAISMFSAMTNMPVYKNRFITGTLDPGNGEVGQIGGSYWKSLVPLRLRDICPAKCKDGMYFLFPAVNMVEYTQDSIFDPWDVKKKLSIIPVQTFAQAFYLATCGPRITTDQVKHADEHGDALMHEGIKRLQETLKRE